MRIACELSPEDSKRILRELLETLCQINDQVDEDTLTPFERNMLTRYTKELDLAKVALPAPQMQVETVMLTIKGKIQRCEDCNSNCFRRTPDRDKGGHLSYRCNGCDAAYLGG